MAAHEQCDIKIVETATFEEPHADGEKHMNVLVRADVQFRWAKPADILFNQYKVSVHYGSNVKTWAEGVMLATLIGWSLACAVLPMDSGNSICMHS